MKKLVFTLLACLVAGSLYSQSKLDLQSKWELMSLRNPSLAAHPSRLKAKQKLELPTHAMAFIQMKGANAKAQLAEAGVNILRCRGNIALASIPLSDVEMVAGMDCVQKLQLSRKTKPMMKASRQAVGIDKIHSGVDLPQAYTGKGVVCGIIDNGFDPNHINFRNADGSTRFGYMSNIYASNASPEGYVYENYYPRTEISESEEKYTYAIEDFKTDDNTDYHGTHTLGIMAGGYKGTLTNATVSTEDQSKSVVSEELNPYYGSAIDAELVASTGDIESYDMFIAYGIDDCINYSLYSNGVTPDGYPLNPKPCVINMSIGRTLGPHDRNGLLNQYLRAAGQEAIVCMAAGNEADYPICLNKTFAGNDTTMQSLIRPIVEGKYPDIEGLDLYNVRSGTYYVYGSDEREFELQLVVYNQNRGKVSYRMPISSSTEGSFVVFASSEDFASGATISTNFAQAFNGYVAIGSILDKDTNRYYAIVYYFTYDNEETNADGHYKLGLVVNGKEGQRVDVYGDAYYTYFDSYGQAGWMDGTKDGTISDLCVGDSVIVVGSYNNTTRWGCLDGFSSFYSEDEMTPGDMSPFSSYGTLSDGRTLPHICAPGTAIVSSASRYFVENSKNGVSEADLTAASTNNDDYNYWLASTGTSMSTPLVAGAIALWLEADPTLGYGDVLDIIRKTAVRDEFVEKGNQIQWGAGKFDAYAGLKEVLRRKQTGIDSIYGSDTTNGQRVVLSACGDNSFNVFLAGAQNLNITVYNTQGMPVLRHSANGDETNVNLGNMPKGVYVLKVNNANAEKITIIK